MEYIADVGVGDGEHEVATAAAAAVTERRVAADVLCHLLF